VLNANSIYIAIPTSLTLGSGEINSASIPLLPVLSLPIKTISKRDFPLAVLPFTLPVGKNFVYGYAQQANLTIERQISKSWKFSLGYQ